MTQKTNSMNGCITPAQQAQFLSDHAHLEGIVVADHNSYNFIRYYTMDGAGFKALFIGGTCVQIIKMSVDEINRIISCAQIKFGGF